LAHCDYDDLV